MKYLKIILLSSLSLIALLLLAVFAYFLLYTFCVFKAELPDSKTEEVYYYLPEVELYVKLESTTVRISRHLCTLTSQHVHSTDLQVMSKQYPSTIYYPFEQNREQRVFIRDPHNCLSVIRNTGSVVWISEKNTVFEIPQSVEIDLPINATDIHYRLPNGADRKAIPLDKGLTANLTVGARLPWTYFLSKDRREQLKMPALTRWIDMVWQRFRFVATGLCAGSILLILCSITIHNTLIFYFAIRVLVE